MLTTRPHVRSAGDGPDVVLLHSSGSSGRQWDALVERLASLFRLHTVDLHGHGSTPAWSDARAMTLADDAALVEPLLAACPRGVHVVGHSYGGAVALNLALGHPQRVLSVTAYEPVVFRVLFEYGLRQAEAQGVLATALAMRARLAHGDNESAAQRFVDFWSGAGTWDAMPLARRQAVAARMPSVMRHFDALFCDTLQRAQISTLAMPALFLTGEGTVAATRRIGELLRHSARRAQHEMLPGLGHLGPVTHAPIVIERVAAFLGTVVARRARLEPLRAAA